jgi:cell fate regulator YaaT (PSP1 superfamily)
MSDTVLVRYGAVPEVARFASTEATPLRRGSRVVVQTRRGTELGTVLEALRNPEPVSQDASVEEPSVLRLATATDEAAVASQRKHSQADFDEWVKRIQGWKLDLELLDIERTLDDEKLILFVLNDQGPDCTKLALYAAAEGLGLIEVQPVNGDGPVELAVGGCSSGGCGSGGCSN